MEIAILSIIDKIYPIGSYYETSNPDFNPEETWGGTWSRDTNGYVTVGCQDPDESGITLADNTRLLINAGATEGEVNHTLTTGEMPSHNHSFSSTTSSSGNHRHSFPRSGSTNAGVLGYLQNGDVGRGKVNTEDGRYYSFTTESQSSLVYINNTEYAGSHTHTVSGNTGNNGDGHSHNNIQPSIGVYRWHRIA